MTLLLVLTSCLAHLIAVVTKTEVLLLRTESRTACHRTSPAEWHAQLLMITLPHDQRA